MAYNGIETRSSNILQFPDRTREENSDKLFVVLGKPEEPVPISKVRDLRNEEKLCGPRLELYYQLWGTDHSGIWKVAEVIRRIAEVFRSKRKG